MTYKQFKKKYNNKLVDYDGSFGSQCWDLVQQYMVECLEVPAYVLGGCGIVSNMLIEPKLSQLLQFFDEVPITNMLQGDIVIWEYGHIAIFDNWDGTNCWYFTQNDGSAENPSGNAHIGLCPKSSARAFRLKNKENKATEENKENWIPKIGDKVHVIKNGKATSYGEFNDSICNFDGVITNDLSSKNRSYPYLVSINNVCIGWYKKDALIKL